MSQSVRLLCLKWLENHLKTMGPVDPAPVDFNYSYSFSICRIGPLGSLDARKASGCGIVVGRETNDPLFPLDQKKLPIAVEWALTRNRGDEEAAVEAEGMLAEVQLRLHEDTTFNGQAVDFREVWNEIDLDSYLDKSIRGVVMMELLYRHHSLDPHVPV